MTIPRRRPPGTPAVRTLMKNMWRMGKLQGLKKDAVSALLTELEGLRHTRNALVPSRVRQRLLRLKVAHEMLDQWEIAMLVTFAETYLQDALAYAAKRDASLMRESEQASTYDQILTAKSTAGLAEVLRERWARAFVDDGGPSRWISRLERMGASGYGTDLAPTLEPLWGIRHCVVHNAGITTQELVKRHPALNLKPGQQVVIAVEQFGACVHAIGVFAARTDVFLLGRIRGRSMPVRLKPTDRESYERT